MKRWFGLMFIFAFGTTLMMGANGASGADNPIKLTIAAHLTPQYEELFPVAQRFIDRINELGQGKVKAEFYHSETLFKVRELVPALINGSCDLIFHTSTHTTGSWPELGGLSLPFLFEDDFDAKERWAIGGEVLSHVNKEMGRKYGVRVMAPGILPGLVMGTKKKAVQSVEDLKGMVIRGTGKPDSEAMKACGASPTFLSSGELYEALQRGTVDGVVTHIGTLVARNLTEVLDYLILMKPRIGSWGYQIYALNKTIDKWPEEVRKIVEVAVTEYDYHYLNNALRVVKSDLMPKITKQMKVVSVSGENMKQFREATLPIQQQWLTTVDKQWGEKLLELSRTPLGY